MSDPSASPELEGFGCVPTPRFAEGDRPPIAAQLKLLQERSATLEIQARRLVEQLAPVLRQPRASSGNDVQRGVEVFDGSPVLDQLVSLSLSLIGIESTLQDAIDRLEV